MGNVSRWYAKAQVERCESGRIGLTANELTWETGSEGSNPSLSAGWKIWLAWPPRDLVAVHPVARTRGVLRARGHRQNRRDCGLA